MSICKNIEIQIKETETIIRRHLKITDGQWEGKPKSMIDSIEKIKDRDLKAIKENYLTFILASAYAYIGKEGCYSLQQILCENMLPPYTEQDDYRIWFQARPLKGKSSPTLDMAFGNIKRPNEDITKAQIEYVPTHNRNGKICFVEMKTWEDLQTSSTGNPRYNQLAKYIRAALIFQKAEIFPEEVHVTLVTPRIFKKNPKSRLYGYKFIEYACPEIHPENIMSDIPIKSDRPPYIENEVIGNGWIKCDKDGMNQRLPFLKLHWVAYEDILDAVPQSPLKDYINRIRDENPIFDKTPN